MKELWRIGRLKKLTTQIIRMMHVRFIAQFPLSLKNLLWLKIFIFTWKENSVFLPNSIIYSVGTVAKVAAGTVHTRMNP